MTQPGIKQKANKSCSECSTCRWFSDGDAGDCQVCNVKKWFSSEAEAGCLSIYAKGHKFNPEPPIQKQNTVRVIVWAFKKSRIPAPCRCCKGKWYLGVALGRSFILCQCRKAQKPKWSYTFNELKLWLYSHWIRRTWEMLGEWYRTTGILICFDLFKTWNLATSPVRIIEHCLKTCEASSTSASINCEQWILRLSVCKNGLKKRSFWWFLFTAL